jgi:hypothetical protein
MSAFTRWAAALVLAAAAATSATAQAPDPRVTPPEVDRSRPGGDPADTARQGSGGGPTGNDITEDNQGGGAPRGVIHPPMAVDPGIQGSNVPDPTPNTTPVIRPPGSPGGDPTVQPR